MIVTVKVKNRKTKEREIDREATENLFNYCDTANKSTGEINNTIRVSELRGKECCFCISDLWNRNFIEGFVCAVCEI